MSQIVECTDSVKRLARTGGDGGSKPTKVTLFRYSRAAVFVESDDRDDTFGRHSEIRMRIGSMGNPSLQDATQLSVGANPFLATKLASSPSPRLASLCSVN
jgi:hypothetical protein